VTVGSLAGSGDSSTSSVNLSTEGSIDWEHWGSEAANRKAGMIPQLSNYSLLVTDTVGSYTDDSRPVSWTGGTSPVTGSNNKEGIYVTGLGGGFSFTAPADATLRTLAVHVGGWKSGGTLTAHLSDGSAADFTDVTTPTNGQYDRNYTLTYRGSAPGQTLTINWAMTSAGVSNGNVTLSAAALQ
jgi:hypothetical protein